MQSDNYVRIARENIDLKSKVSSLEEQLDQLRGELQKTHIHQHFTKGGTSTDKGATTTSPPPGAQPTTRFYDSDPSSSSEVTAKLEAEIARLNSVNAVTQKKLETALGEADHTRQMCEKRIWQLQHEFELLSANSNASKREDEKVVDPEDAKELIYQKKWNTTFSTPTTTTSGDSLSSQQQRGEIDGLKAAMQVLQAELEKERAQREEGETMLEIVQNELADTQQQLADAVLPPGDDEDGGPPPEEEYDEDGAPPPFSPPASPSRTGKLSPSMAREESILFQEEHAAKIEEIVQQRLEEEKYLIEVDHEDDMNTLKIEMAEKDAKIKELSLELGRSQLAQKNHNNNGAKRDAPVLPVVEEDMWTSPTKRSKNSNGGVGNNNMISAADYEAALEKIEQAESGKAQAMKKVAELAEKLNQLQRKQKQHDSKTPATTSIGVALLDGNRPSDRDSNWAERLLAEKDVELAEAQSHRLTAESELSVVNDQLSRINAKHQEEIGKLNNAQSILEREIQDLKRDRDQQNQRAQGAGAKNALLLSRKAPGSGSGITFGRTAGSNGNADSLNSSFASGDSQTPKKAAPPKAPLRERLLQKQAIRSKAAASSGGGGGDHVSLEERTKCVDGAADKADMIVGRLTRMMVVGTAEGSKAPRHWDPSKGTDPSLGNGDVNSALSEDTKDALSEMLAESLMDYEFALSQLRNEVLSLRTIVTMTESDVREEYQGRLSRMEAEMGDLRAAAQMHDEDRSRLHQQQQQRARPQQ